MSDQHVIVGLGEILWDVFPTGPRFGGAPANFACHAAGLGARTYVVSSVGNDALGDKAITALKEHGVQTNYVQRSAAATGSVQVVLDRAGQASYDFARDNQNENRIKVRGAIQTATEKFEAESGEAVIRRAEFGDK